MKTVIYTFAIFIFFLSHQLIYAQRFTDDPEFGVNWSTHPIVSIRSDDWCGGEQSPDLETYLTFTPRIYRFRKCTHTMEDEDTIRKLIKILLKHKGADGHPVIITPWVIPLCFDFEKIKASQYKEFSRIRIDQGFPGRWYRGDLIKVQREAVANKVFFPEIHGSFHHIDAHGFVRMLPNSSDLRKPFEYQVYQLGTPFPHYGQTPEEVETEGREAAEAFKNVFGRPSSRVARSVDRDIQLEFSNWWAKWYTEEEMHALVEKVSNAIVEMLNKPIDGGVCCFVHRASFTDLYPEYKDLCFRYFDKFLELLIQKKPNIVFVSVREQGMLRKQGWCVADNGPYATEILCRNYLPEKRTFHVPLNGRKVISVFRMHRDGSRPVKYEIDEERDEVVFKASEGDYTVEIVPARKPDAGKVWKEKAPKLTFPLYGSPKKTVTKPFSQPVKPKIALIPAGSFIMGYSGRGYSQHDSEPKHRVTISQPFYLGVHEVTQKEYESLMGVKPSFAEGDDLPVEGVTWFDAVRYCNTLSRVEGFEPCYDESTWTCDFSKNGYRLPTEAEWEYACRAGAETNFPWGDYIDERHCSTAKPEGLQTNKVDIWPANQWGLYGMNTNVWEWCNDWYGPYQPHDQTDPRGAKNSYRGRVIRGGGWFNEEDKWSGWVFSLEKVHYVCASHHRAWFPPGYCHDFIGFRICRNAP